MVGARSRRYLASTIGHRVTDQLERVRPVEAHAALRGVHGLGDAEAPGPEMAAIRERRVPIDGRVEPRLLARQRIGDDMRRGERLARERTLRLVELLRLADWIFLH